MAATPDAKPIPNVSPWVFNSINGIIKILETSNGTDPLDSLRIAELNKLQALSTKD